MTLTILDQTADIRAMQTAEAVTKRQVSVSLVVKLDGKALCVIQVRLKLFMRNIQKNHVSFILIIDCKSCWI